MGIDAITKSDHGNLVIPSSTQDWQGWISATDTRNFLLQDPLLDWLDLYGEEKRFQRDTDLPGYDPRTDFTKFIFEKTSEFEAAVIAYLKTITSVSTIASSPSDARKFEKVQETFAAMETGVPLVYHGVLWDAENRTYGIPDLLIRSNELIRLFPSALTRDEAAQGAKDLQGAQVLAAGPPPSGLCYQVGTWNLEHFHEGRSRGFPENTRGGPSYPARTANDLSAIAAAIRDTLDVKILILNEIMGEEREVEEEVQSRSELDALLTQLGPSYQYLITSAGGSQRVALLYDTRHVRLNSATEIPVPPTRVQGKDIFARDPLMAYFTFLHDGQPQNDLLLVGLHLASGQRRARNHDAAMALLLRRLNEARNDGTVLPTGEFDLILGGDLNASMFDNNVEQFFTDLNTGNWAVLAGTTYPATRLAGVPLAPRSQIDYLIVTRQTGSQAGLLGEEITAPAATVHQELAHGAGILSAEFSVTISP